MVELTQAVNVAKAAKKLGAEHVKRSICPGCGSIKEYDGLVFDLKTLDGSIKEIKHAKAQGLAWCSNCGGRA